VRSISKLPWCVERWGARDLLTSPRHRAVFNNNNNNSPGYLSTRRPSPYAAVQSVTVPIIAANSIRYRPAPPISSCSALDPNIICLCASASQLMNLQSDNALAIGKRRKLINIRRLPRLPRLLRPENKQAWNKMARLKSTMVGHLRWARPWNSN